MDKKDASLEGVLKRIIKKLGPGGNFTEEGVADAWRYAVGDAAAKHAAPASFRNGVLIVNVDSSGWLYDLTIRKGEILEKMCERLKAARKIKQLRFRIGDVK